MKHILVTTDLSTESTKAFGIALEQARLHPEAKITLLAVLEDVAPTSVQFEFGLSLIDSKGVLEEAHAQATQKVEELRVEYFSGFPTIAMVIRATRAVALEITDFAKTHAVDFIVMTTHGRHGIKRLVMGSVSEGVIREACCPVLIVPLKEPTP